MKYSISILFLLTILAAVESVLFRKLEWPILVTVGLCLALFWTHWQTRLTAFTKYSSKDAINLSIALCVGGAIVSVLSGETNSAGKLLNVDPRMVSANSILILATILLSSSLVHAPTRTYRPLRIVLSTLIVAGLIVCLAHLADPLFWYVYMACRGIENSLRDPHRILGESRVLLYNSAAIKAAVGVLGWSAWIAVAIFTYRRVQRKSTGSFSEAWIACGLACLATYFQWRYLLDDFPELRESLNGLLRATYTYNVALFGVLGATGFFLYCMIDRSRDQPRTCSDSIRRNRLLGVAMMAPTLLILAERAFSLSRISIGGLGWILFAVDVFGNESFMLLALFLLGVRVFANAKNGPASFLTLPATSLFQLWVISCLLTLLVPMHFAASQFYFDAVMMLAPGY
jgi:hypothetical protein